MIARYENVGLRWQAFTINGTGIFRAAERAVERRMGRILDSWEGTPYDAGQAQKGVGAFCTAFVVGVLDELYRCAPTPLPLIPQDAAMHDPDRARAGLRWFLERYPRHERIPNGIMQPGDVLVTGPVGGGPGHALIVGPRENTIWQCSGQGVHYTGLALPTSYRLHSIYRMTNRTEWL